jgi:phosphatidylinositol alpha-mannosyltransferase
MKIGLVCPYDISKGGGVQECVRAIRSELSRRGHEALIITPQPKGTNTTQDDGILFIGTMADIKSPFATTAQVSVSVNTDDLDRMLKQQNFDILHFHEPWVPILSRQILTRSTSKNIATFHAKLPETLMARTIERVVTPYTKSIMKYLDGLTAVSTAAAEYATSLTDKPFAIIPNGIDLYCYKPQPKKRYSDEKRQILFIGRLEKRKGVKYLLKAMSILAAKHPGAELTVAGNGPDRAKLEAQARSLKNVKVKFLGYVDEPTKQQLFSEADVLCSPALYGESFGIVLLEAMASNLPVVAGDNPGYSSVMRGQGAASTVNPKDTEEFASKLEKFLYDDSLRAAWSTWASEDVKQYSYPKVVDQYERLYEHVLNGVEL